MRPVLATPRDEEMNMRRRMSCLVLMCAAVVSAALYHARTVGATPSSGYSSSTLALGRFGEFDVFNKYMLPPVPGERQNDRIWLSWQKTKGDSDLYVQTNTWQPGGTTGWHSHPGHSLIIVTAGTVTDYEGDDPNCTPHVYTQGMGFVDPGGDHVHMVRNEGKVMGSTIAVQLIPAGASRKIDAPDPGNCHF
jgi:hypothetical protein